MPYTASFNFAATIRNKLSNTDAYDKKDSKTSFLLLNDGKNYTAYLMTIIGDPTYLKNDLGKLSLTTYRKRDTDFTGLVLYFTPKGSYVSGFRYKNGKLVTSSTASTTNAANTASPPFVAAKTLNSNKFTSDVAAPPSDDCTDWYEDVYYGDELLYSTYLYTSCTGTDNDNDGGGGTPPASTPPPCPGSGGGDDDAAGFTADVAQQPPSGGDGDGGLPPPVNGQDNSCTVAKPDTITKDPCKQSQQLASDQPFENTLNILKSDINKNYEVDYIYTDPSNTSTYTSEQGDPNETNVDFDLTGQIAGAMHSHPGGMVDENGDSITLSPTPTPDDFAFLWQAYSGGNMNNPSTFTETVLTAQSTAYMITISNVNKFAAWAATNLTPSANGETLFYTNASASGNSYLTKGYSNLQAHELALLDNLANSGLTLIRGNYGNLNTWTPLSSSNGAVIVDNCN